MMISAIPLFLLVITTLTAPPSEEPASFAALANDYDSKVRPLLGQYCLKCHSTAEQEGDLDLERFTKFDDVRRDGRVWLKVVEMLDNGDMPPKKSKALPREDRVKLRGWVRGTLDAVGRANAGDPGPVVLRRLSNVEYNNTVRDLTNIDLQPAREFPGDGAAGEGFSNVGEALMMSPAMLDKYLAAAKGMAAHAVLLPTEFRFSEKTTRPDWTNEILSRIRSIYARHTDPDGSTRVNLQGLVWETNAGGRIPLKLYLTALLANRDALSSGKTTIAEVASRESLSPKYLRTLFALLTKDEHSPILENLRARWKTAGPADVDPLVDAIRQWQVVLTKFKSVGHFKPWQEAVNPLTESQPFRIKLAPAPDSKAFILRLTTHDAGDGAEGDLIEWKQPRFESPGRPSILLRDVRDGMEGLVLERKTLPDAARYLAAVEEIRRAESKPDVAAIASGKSLDPLMLNAWLEFLGIAGKDKLKIETLFSERMEKGGAYDFIKGWGSPATPSVLANSSDMRVRIPGIMRPHGISVHPAPTRSVAVGWRSPITGQVRIETHVAHAHPECGDGMSWSLELRRGGERRRLASGEITNGKAPTIAPVEKLAIHEGDLISLSIGPRGNHSCDMTEIDLTITPIAADQTGWSLSGDVSPNILAGNPHADQLGHREVWYFYHEPLTSENSGAFAAIPNGSLLDRWRDESQPGQREQLAIALGNLLARGTDANTPPSDALLYRQLTSLSGPLLGRLDLATLSKRMSLPDLENKDQPETFGLSRSRFGTRTDSANLISRAPEVVEFRLPSELLAGRDFVVDSALDPDQGGNGSAQVEVTIDKAASTTSLIPGLPIVTRPEGASRKRFETWFDDFRRVFPAALCYSQIVPVDEVVTLALYHREDEPLSRLMLDEAESQRLDRLWDELEFVSQEAFKVEVGYVQFMEYTTQDSDPNLFKPLRKPIAERASALRRHLIEVEPKHLESLIAFADRAYRRPLSPDEQAGLRMLYAKLRAQDLDHEAAFRLTLARILMAPSFLYRAERPSSGITPQAVSQWELASRLSYFLWSSPPDEELRRIAADGTLLLPDVLSHQAQRMLGDDRVRALATEFACQWLDIHDFDINNDKSEQVFPEFAALRGAMYEEPVRFFIDLFRNNGSVLDIIDSDHTFMNPALAKHYGISGVKGPDWQRVEGVRTQGRGGVLAMAAVLAKQSGASRTSPILRGNWLVEMLLGEKLPKPPKNVPLLPESELDTGGLTMREITEKHRAVESCAKCHNRIDPFGFALEGYDAIGRRRKVDLGGRPIDTHAVTRDGKAFNDISGLRDYLLTQRRDDFLKQFCRKLLGYSLGRSVQLSDEPLIAEMQKRLAGKHYQIQDAILAAVLSPQFRMQRGLQSPIEDHTTQ